MTDTPIPPIYVALLGQKGGTGKSTLAVCLAVEAAARGYSTLLVDADPQQTALRWAHLATHQEKPVPPVVAMGAGMHSRGQLPRIAASYEIVFIDCPGRAGDVQRSALAVTSLALLPCGPTAFDAWALGESAEVAREAQGIRPELQVAVVLTRKQRTAASAAARGVLLKAGLPVLQAEIGHRNDFALAVAFGQGVTTFAPRSVAAEETRRLFDELRKMTNLSEKKHGQQQEEERAGNRRRARASTAR